MEKHLISTHKNLEDSSTATKTRRIGIAWAVFLTIALLPAVPPVHDALAGFVSEHSADLLGMIVRFYASGRVNYFTVVVVIYSVIEMTRRSQWFSAISLYDEGIGVEDRETGEEFFADRTQLHFLEDPASDAVQIGSDEYPISEVVLRFKKGKYLSDSQILKDNLTAHFLQRG